jgi:hypothetical protein
MNAVAAVSVAAPSLLNSPQQIKKRISLWAPPWAPFLVGCLTCLVLLTRRENLRIRDLLGPLPRWLLPKASRVSCWFFPSSYWRATRPSHRLRLLARTHPAPGTDDSPLTCLGGFSVIRWPVWSVTEEFTYNGY